LLSYSRLALLSAHTQETSAKQLCDLNVTRIYLEILRTIADEKLTAFLDLELAIRVAE
jgi:hypothetical protein